VTARAVTLDMGGTSADVGVVVDGQLQFSGRYEVEWGIPITVPIIDVTTIGAGGSSIATIDYGGLLRVGPESAGADPGPACYGKGGSRPTITDANVVLGRLDPSFFLGGELLLDADLAAKAIASIGEPLGLSLEAAAEAVIAVSVENMAGAVRLVTVDRGHDYREFDLIAFGGAGPLHAAQIADSMGMRRAVVPPAPGLVSAFGAVIADERLDRRTTLVRRLDRETDEIARTLSALARSMVDELAEQTGRPRDSVIVHTFVSCRYVGQNYEQEIRTYKGHVDKTFELAVPVNPGRDDFLTDLAAAFHHAHESSYGYSMQDQAIESVYLGATALIPGDPVPLQPYDGEGERRTRQICAGGRWLDAEIVDRSLLRPGDTLAGPAVIVEPTSTTYVPERFTGEVDADHCLLLTKHPDAPTEDGDPA
jgi:N-methylhydantoinase A